MQDVVRKRVVGAGVLVLLGLLLPLLLSRCMHDSGLDGEQAMRIYEINSAGEIELMQPAASDGAGNTRVASALDGAGTQPAVPASTAMQDNAAADTSQQAPDEYPPATADAAAQDETDAASATDTSADTGQQPTQQQTQQQQQTQNQTDAVKSTSEDTTADAAPQPTPQPATPSEHEPADASTLKRSVASGAWIVQVASFQKETNSRALARQLAADFPAYYTTAAIDGQTWYRVRIGPLDGAARASNKAAELRALGHDTLVLQVD